MPERMLSLHFPSRAALAHEYDVNLSAGRAFVPDVPDAQEFALFSACRLVLQHPDSAQAFEIACEVVMVLDAKPYSGVALQFRQRGQKTLDAIRAFIGGAGAAEPPPAAESGSEAGTWAGVAELPDDEARAEPPERAQGVATDPLRNLSAAARNRVAQSGMLEDRVKLERLYGPAVWESLLRNPKLTVPEVSTMARKGTLPRPLLDLIAENENWIRQSSVQRALLANPRLGGKSLTKVLRALSARELKLVPQQTAYPAQVRSAAQQLLRGG